MALIGVACSCGHVGVVSSATLPRVITCSSCGYARQIGRDEGYAIHGWRRTKATKAARACVAEPSVSPAADGSPIATQQPERMAEPVRTSDQPSAADHPASLPKAALTSERGAILADWFSRRG